MHQYTCITHTHTHIHLPTYCPPVKKTQYMTAVYVRGPRKERCQLQLAINFTCDRVWRGRGGGMVYHAATVHTIYHRMYNVANGKLCITVYVACSPR